MPISREEYIQRRKAGESEDQIVASVSVFDPDTGSARSGNLSRDDYIKLRTAGYSENDIIGQFAKSELTGLTRDYSRSASRYGQDSAGGWRSKQNAAAYLQSAQREGSSIRERAERVRRLMEQYDTDDETRKSMSKTLDDIMAGASGISEYAKGSFDYWSQFRDEGAYHAYLKEQDEYRKHENEPGFKEWYDSSKLKGTVDNYDDWQKLKVQDDRNAVRDKAAQGRDSARGKLRALEDEKAQLAGYITDDYTAAMYADRIAELDRQIDEAKKDYGTSKEEYEAAFADYNAARDELKAADSALREAQINTTDPNYAENVKAAETRLARAKEAYIAQGGDPNANVISAGLRGSAAGVVDTAGYLQELGQPENEKRWGPFTTGHTTDEDKHRKQVLEERRKAKYEAEHGAGTYEYRPDYQRTQEIAGRLAEQSASEIESMKTGKSELGQFAVDMGVQGVQMAADAAAGKILPGGSLTAMALRSFGSGVREARDEGANIYQQGLYGAGTAAVEVLTEKIFDGMAGIYGAGAADDIVSHAIGRFTKNKLGQAALGMVADAAGEGLEEVASDLLNPVLKSIYDEHVFDNGYLGALDGQEILYDFLVGAAMGLVGGSIETVSDMTGLKAPDARSEFFMEAGENGMSIGEAVREWQRQQLNSGYAKMTDDQSITNRANELEQSINDKRFDPFREGKITRLNQRAANQISTEDIANTVTAVEARMQQLGQSDPKLAQAIAAVALEGEAERIGARGVGATKAQQDLVKSNPVAQRILSEMDVENMRNEQAAEAINEIAAIGGASAEDMQKLVAPYQRSNEWVKSMRQNKALASDVYGQDSDRVTVSESDREGVTLDGQRVKIVGAQKDGKVVVEQNGERKAVDTDALEGLTDGYRQLIEKAAVTGSSEPMLRLFHEGQDVNRFVKAWDYAENVYGAETQATFEQVRKSPLVRELDDTQLKQALEMGRESAKQKAEEIKAKSEKFKAAREEARKKGGEQRKKGTVRMHESMVGKTLTRQQKNIVAMVNAMADAVNLDYELYAGKADEGGSYISGGTIRINVNSGEFSGKYIGAATLSHEITHFLKDFAPEEYADLKDFITTEVIKKSPSEFDRLVQIQMRAETNLTREEAVDEVIANACQKMLLSDKTIAKLARQNMTLAEKIADRVEDFTAKFKAAYEDVDLSDDIITYHAVRAIEDFNEGVQERFAWALEAATENYNAAQATGLNVGDGSVKFSREEALSFDIEWDPDNKSHLANQLRKYGYKVSGMKPVFSMSFKVGKNGDYSAKLDQLLRERFDYKVETQNYGTVLFDRTGVGNLRSHVTNDAQAAAVVASPYVIKRGKAITGHRNHKGNGYPSVTFAAPVEINGKIGIEAVTAMYTTKNRVHAVEILAPDGTEFVIETKKDAESTTPVASPEGAVSPTDSTSVVSIADTAAESKQKLSVDSTGRELSEGQQRFFADSRIRDAQGRLKVMYRGGAGGFTVFDRKKSSYSNLYGRGFYFTDSEEHASQYGKAHPYYLNITNPLTQGAKTFTSKQIRAFLEAVAEDEDYGLENYGYGATVASVMQGLKGKDDFGVISDINATCIGDMVAAAELFNEVNGTSFDGIVVPTETVAFSSEQIKEIDNENPTSNPDTRYQKLGIGELQAKYDSYIDAGKELTDVRNQIRTWKKTADYRRVMDNIGNAKGDELQRAIEEYGEWERTSGFAKLYEREKELSSRYDRLRKEYEAMSLENEQETEREQMEKSGKSEGDFFRDKAVKEFGYTPYYYDAGYIVPNGKMLNFSGEKGKHFGSRGQDHRAIGTIFTSNFSGSEAMLRFMAQGNIRIMAETPGIDINSTTEPTKEQYAAIRKFASDSARKEYFNVDFTDERGNTVGSIEYEDRVRPDRVINDIKHFYATGEVREQGLSQFYQKLGYAETEEEQEAREESVANLKAENDVLRARAKYWKDQTRQTKERTVRQQDTDRLANDLLRKFESRTDKSEVKAAIKELGDWLVQTQNLDYDELRDKAEAIAEEIVDGNYTLIDDSNAENLSRLKDYLKSTALNLSAADFRDTGDENFRRKYGRYLTVNENGRSIDSAWGELSAMFGEGMFPEDVYAPGDMLNMIADYLDLWKPQYGNAFEMFRGEAVDAATNEIIDRVLSEEVRQAPATYADKAQQKLNAQIAKDREKLDALRAQKNARIEEIRQQAAEKNRQIRAAEKAAKYEAVSKVKQHYQDMIRQQRGKRSDTAVRKKIKALHKELNDILLKPKEGRYVPRELVKATAEILGAVDTTSGRAVKAKAALAELRVKYEALAKDPKYSLTYDETVSGMIQEIAKDLGDESIYELTGSNLEGVYNVLKALKHAIRTANQLVGAEIEATAFEAANQMMDEAKNAKSISTKFLRKFVFSQLTPERFGNLLSGYRKNGMWKQMMDMLNRGQMTQTQIMMEGGEIFRELIGDKRHPNKMLKTLHDQKHLVDIGLKDQSGNAVKITRGMMLSVYMHLLNEDNARHVAYGGFTVPRFAQYYKGQMGEAFTGKTGRAVAYNQEAAALAEELETADAARQEEILTRLEEIEASRAEDAASYIEELRENIEKELTDYDRKWIEAVQYFFDVYSKEKLNEVTEMVYGFEKAQVDHYFPIHTDQKFRTASFDSIARDFSLENAGFMKKRVYGANPIQLEDITDVVSTQLRKTAQYVGLMPAIRNFNKAYGKARMGYSDSVQDAVSRTFNKQGLDYIENLMADLNGARRTEADIFDEIRGNVAGAALTLSPRVTLAQMASYPTAAAEIGYRPLAKALADIAKNPMFNSTAAEEISKWTPLWWYRMQGFSTVELGDIKNNEQALSKVLQKMKWATGWIQFADGLTTGGLWQASKYYVEENFPDLEKGSEEYFMKVAETYNRVIERTQPNYTTMQRPDILRNPSKMVKQFTMFLTQRLQNFNLMYDAIATYNTYAADLRNGRNGVTAKDVKTAGTRLAWTLTSQVVASGMIVAFKYLADMLLHSMNAYRDDDDELTEESRRKALLIALAETMTSNALWGSEVFNIIKTITTGDKYYGLSLSSVEAISETLIAITNGGRALVTGDTEKAQKEGVKLGKQIAQVFGIPVNNAMKIVNGFKLHVEDAKNGALGSFEAGVERSEKQNTHILFDALESGDKERAEQIRETFDGKKDEQGALKSYVHELYAEDKTISKNDVVQYLQKYAGMTRRSAEDTAQQWSMEVETGIDYDKLTNAYVEGKVTKAQAETYFKTYSSFGHTTLEEAQKKVLEWTCEKETGIAYGSIDVEVKTGRLGKERAVAMVMKYGGKSEETADKQVEGWMVEHEYNIKPSELQDEYMAGNIDAETAYEILMRYQFNGKEDANDKAADTLEKWNFIGENPGTEDITVTQIHRYKNSGLEGVVSGKDFLDAYEATSIMHGIDTDGDGKANRNTRVDQQLAYIDGMALTGEQKTALALALGINERTVRNRAPWSAWRRKK